MEREFWLERWQTNQLGFHRADTNPLLERFWPELSITKGSGVFVPLCGKSLDMRFLEALGHPVFGVEFSETAIRSYFEEGGENPRRNQGFYLARYSGAHSTLYCGDFFDLAASDILGARAVYDRGALIALPPVTRVMYVDHLLRIIPEHAHVLLITLEYEQSLVQGPPFSVTEEEVNNLYSPRCRVNRIGRLTTQDIPPKFAKAGVESVDEAVYHIIKDH